MMPFSRYFAFVLLVALLAVPGPVFAQGTKEDYERALSLRDRFSNKVFKETISPAWSDDGGRFTYRNRLPGGRTEFVSIDVKTGERKTSSERDETGGFSPETLKPVFRKIRTKKNGDATELHFVNKSEKELELFWVDDGGKEISYGKLAFGATRTMNTYDGHVWLVRDGDGKIYGYFESESVPKQAILSEYGEIVEEKPEKNPAISPDGLYELFFRDHGVRLRSVDGRNVHGAPVKGPHDDIQIAPGTAENFYEGPVCWSPASKYVVVRKTIRGEDRKVYYVESSPKDRLQPKLHHYDYRKPGDRIPISKIHLFRIETKKSSQVIAREIPISDELFPNPWSLSEFQWDKDGKRFYFLYNERGHQVLRYLAVDAESGEVKTVAEEKSETFVDYTNKIFIRRLDDTDELIWMSQRDGWNHLYLIDTKTGETKNRITRGDWVVRSVEKIDPENRVVWFYAGGVHPEQDPYYLHYCRVDFDGKNFRILTEGNGTHKIQHSPDRKYFIDTYSRVDMPPIHELRCAETGKLICSLENADHSELLKAGWRAPERFVAKGRDGATDIYGVIIRSTNFDPEKKYPVIECIYAGPHGSFVPKNFRSFYDMNVLAELGFILVQIDGMGTNHRSKAFHDVCWKNLGDSGFPDRILWLRAAAEKYPSMDLSRVGIYGGSAGGQSSTRALLAHGDFYKVAVSDCGCHDNRMDKIWWNEQWMGWPLGPHYEEQSNVTQAHRLTGKLMLIVGEMDENVDPASTMQVAAALIKADKDFELLVMPGQGHGAAGHPYARRRQMDFFVRHLLGVEPRQTK